MSAGPATSSFARDIRPLFTETDVEHMQAYGLDLSDYAEVKSKADDIYSQVASGKMPPPPGKKWSDAMCATFKTWQSQGCPP